MYSVISIELIIKHLKKIVTCAKLFQLIMFLEYITYNLDKMQRSQLQLSVT